MSLCGTSWTTSQSASRNLSTVLQIAAGSPTCRAGCKVQPLSTNHAILKTIVPVQTPANQVPLHPSSSAHLPNPESRLHTLIFRRLSRAVALTPALFASLCEPNPAFGCSFCTHAFLSFRFASKPDPLPSMRRRFKHDRPLPRSQLGAPGVCLALRQVLKERANLPCAR